MDTIDRIFDLQRRSGMSQQEFAVAVGVAEYTVSDWKNRRSGSYSRYLIKIAQALNTSVDFLVSGEKTDTLHTQSNETKLENVTYITTSDNIYVVNNLLSVGFKILQVTKELCFSENEVGSDALYHLAWYGDRERAIELLRKMPPDNDGREENQMIC